MDADTETRITGYYNGYAVCSFPVRNYDYNPLAWLYYGAGTALRWKTNVCVWEVQG